MDKKMTQKGLLTLILILVLAVFAVLNICSILIAQRYGLSLDLTEEKLYELSSTTREACEALANPTTVYVLSAENDYPAMYREVLARYGKLSDKLTIAYVDPADNPLLISHYEQMGLSPSAADLLVEGGTRAKVIAYKDMLVYNGEDVSGIDIEQQLTAAILYVNSKDNPIAAFTAGHGERPTNGLTNLFESNNFVTKNVALGIDALDNPAMVVIAAPAYDFKETEVEALNEYLSGGGRLMVFIEPSVTPFPTLKAFLARWGMNLNDNIVFEQKAYAAGSPNSIIPMYASHAINAYFADHQIYTVLPGTRSITISSPAPNLATVSPVLLTTSDAYAKKDMQYISAQKAEGDAAGTFVAAAVAEKGEGETRAALFLAGSRMIYADDIMSMSSYANRLFLTQVINYLREETHSISIAPKMLASTALAITTSQSMTAGMILVIVLPPAVLAAGIAVRLRRRHL